MTVHRLFPNAGMDVYDLPEEDRDSLYDHERSEARRDSFSFVGIDDFTETDKVIRRNGRSVFITEPV